MFWRKVYKYEKMDLNELEIIDERNEWGVKGESVRKKFDRKLAWRTGISISCNASNEEELFESFVKMKGALDIN